MIGRDGRKIRNIGDLGAKWLEGIGVTTLSELAEIGSVEAYRRIKVKHGGVSVLALYALECALLDMHWNELPPEVKEALHEQVGYVPKRKPKTKREGRVPT